MVTTCRDAVSCLESLGAELIQIRIPELELLRIGHMLTISGEKTELFHAQFFSKPDRHRMNGDVQMSLRMADGILVREYLQAQVFDSPCVKIAVFNTTVCSSKHLGMHLR